MPEIKATSFGFRARSAQACFRAASTPKSPQPAHHHDGVAVAKSFGLKTVAIVPLSRDGMDLKFRCYRVSCSRCYMSLDGIEDLDRAEWASVIFAHGMHVWERPRDGTDEAL